jgi:hypothetical protein
MAVLKRGGSSRCPSIGGFNGELTAIWHCIAGAHGQIDDGALELVGISQRPAHIQILIYSGRMMPGVEGLPGCTVFIAKPWSSDGLARHVREAVERAVGSASEREKPRP